MVVRSNPQGPRCGDAASEETALNIMITIAGFLAIFLAVFVLYLGFAKVAARRAERKESDKLWAEGQRRRAETADSEAWKANQKMPWK